MASPGLINYIEFIRTKIASQNINPETVYNSLTSIENVSKLYEEMDLLQQKRNLETDNLVVSFNNKVLITMREKSEGEKDKGNNSLVYDGFFEGQDVIVKTYRNKSSIQTRNAFLYESLFQVAMTYPLILEKLQQFNTFMNYIPIPGVGAIFKKKAGARGTKNIKQNYKIYTVLQKLDFTLEQFYVYVSKQQQVTINGVEGIFTDFDFAVVLIGIFIILQTLSSTLNFVHRDLHMGNIMLKVDAQNPFQFEYNNIQFATILKPYIIDLGQSCVILPEIGNLVGLGTSYSADYYYDCSRKCLDSAILFSSLFENILISENTWENFLVNFFPVQNGMSVPGIFMQKLVQYSQLLIQNNMINPASKKTIQVRQAGYFIQMYNNPNEIPNDEYFQFCYPNVLKQLTESLKTVQLPQNSMITQVNVLESPEQNVNVQRAENINEIIKNIKNKMENQSNLLQPLLRKASEISQSRKLHQNIPELYNMIETLKQNFYIQQQQLTSQLNQVNEQNNNLQRRYEFLQNRMGEDGYNAERIQDSLEILNMEMGDLEDDVNEINDGIIRNNNILYQIKQSIDTIEKFISDLPEPNRQGLNNYFASFVIASLKNIRQVDQRINWIQTEVQKYNQLIDILKSLMNINGVSIYNQQIDKTDVVEAEFRKKILLALDVQGIQQGNITFNNELYTQALRFLETNGEDDDVQLVSDDEEDDDGDELMG